MFIFTYFFETGFMFFYLTWEPYPSHHFMYVCLAGEKLKPGKIDLDGSAAAERNSSIHPPIIAVRVYVSFMAPHGSNPDLNKLPIKKNDTHLP